MSKEQKLTYTQQGYNEMMMSEKFYELFSDYEYILICHVDAWLFRNELVEWCRKGYDHVAAPWPMRPRYGRFPLKQYLKLKLWLKPKRKIIHCQMLERLETVDCPYVEWKRFARPVLIMPIQ